MTQPMRQPTRGGKGGSEPRLRLRRREQEVIRLATEGHGQHEIARRVGISQAAVSKLIRRVDDRWHRENQDQLTRYRAQQTRKLDHLYREAMRAWEASKAQRTRRRQRKTDGGSPGGGGQVAEVTVDDSHGDSRYLEAARRILADHARIVGTSQGDRKGTASHELPAVFTLNIGDERTAPKRRDMDQNRRNST